MSGGEGNCTPTRCLSEISEEETASFSVDLVSAAGRNLAFLRLVSDSHWLHHKPTLLQAIRRYDQLWMPLIADLTRGPKPPMLLPPLDVEWVWFCHTSLNPINYRNYCETRFSKPIGKAAIFDEENEEYAVNRCREIWAQKFPSEPFENETNLESSSSSPNPMMTEDDHHVLMILNVLMEGNLWRGWFKEPYCSEMVYLVAAKQRYKGFIYLLHRFGEDCGCLVPTSDVLLMWLTHKSYPTVYAADVKELENNIEKTIRAGDAVKEEDVEETKMLWERTFDQPYEKAGGAAVTQSIADEPPFFWDVTDVDVNTRYKSMGPRFLFEVCVSLKVVSNIHQTKRDPSREFLRLRMLKGHRELKMDKPLSFFTSEAWQKAWHLYCEFGTKGLTLELRRRGGRFSNGSSLLRCVSFSWNDILRAPSLMFGKEIDERLRAVASITPPAQGPYLLKCVPDRVTDDSGAMISDVILKMNHYRPQEGRWLARTILDHAGRECFVTRMRIGEGFWRRGGEVPRVVKWDEQTIEIHEGSWSYVYGSTAIGRSSGKVIGTATPKEPPEGFQASWKFSTGHELLIQWTASKSISGLRFDVVNEQTSESTVIKVLQGRRLQYEVKKSSKEEMERGNIKEEDEYVTLIRVSEENPSGKATALLNWKLLAVELQPEEDFVLILLLCLSILRSISEMRREDIGGLLVRRRMREAKIGDRDWESAILHSLSSCSPPGFSSPYVQPWYWDATSVMAFEVKDHGVAPQSPSYSPAEGGDKLYKSVILP